MSNLPPLPEPDHSLDCGTMPFFREDQMRAYAEEAVRLEREAIFEAACRSGDEDFMKRYAGNMTAQEYASANAVVVAIRSAIRARSQEGNSEQTTPTP